MLRPFLPEVIPLNVIGNNKVKLINATSYNYGGNCGVTWPISHRGRAPKRALLNQSFTLVELQRKLHHHTNALGALVARSVSSPQ